MCLYPKIIPNPRYKPNKKNGGVIPPLRDYRHQYIAVGCGQCIECRKKKARWWKIRIAEELKTTHGEFVTLTFSEESLKKISEKIQSEEANDIAREAVKLFRERWRKKYKKSIRHWLVTELGHKGTERLHLHGILFTNKKKDIGKIWNYGWVYIGKYCNEKTANYIVKYVTKVDKDHPGYKQIILESPGIGNGYVSSERAKRNKYQKRETKANYRLECGLLVDLPIYYRNKLYTEREREMLWSYTLDEKKRYVLGREVEIKTAAGIMEYQRLLKGAQEQNKRMGYEGDGEWKEKEYKASLSMLNEAAPARPRKKV